MGLSQLIKQANILIRPILKSPLRSNNINIKLSCHSCSKRFNFFPATMESEKMIPLQGRKDDPLRYGIHGVKSDIIESHPLQSAYRSAKLSEEEMKRKVLTHTYGAAFSMRMELDRQILSKFQRPPGTISSSFLGLEAMTGTLDGFGFEDYLNDPRDSESFRPVDMHHGMEVQLGISNGPPCPSFI